MPLKFGLLCVLACVLTGCGLPEAGPKASRILEEAAARAMPPFAVVDVTSTAMVKSVARPVASFAAYFGEGARDPGLRIAVGDVVSVSLWEAPPGSLFGMASSASGQQQATGSSVTIPPQTINSDGTISIPYVGRITAAGRTPASVEKAVVSGLMGKAVQPQALVTVQQSSSNTVTVTGEVAGGARVALSPAGSRVLDAIAAAGGLRAGVNDSVVYLTRGGRTMHLPFTAIVQNPRENVRLRPEDVVTVVREPTTYTILGASGQNGEVPFSVQHLTMANAVARAGGLQDTRADASGVFLFRYEPLEVARRIVAPSNPLLRRGGPVPIVYRFNLKNGSTLLAMQNFEVQPRDIIYISNASSIDIQKFMGLFQGVTGTALSAASVGISASAAN
ncbi:polysaccharide export outer membrane protein [Rhizobium sp. ERR 922]|uniref:Capsular polysaccharide biosynthesis protein n=1 Tax=Rhizobium dioscoreae TaxID=2653122 RepID=A0ABQ0ZEL6_9HYPH|nr:MULTISPECIES: polysaccharide biosynthesis/export family protein [Rhizobium]TWB57449.1 polysaccharide export outer membrane protein [Rhizobium sp. ERR 922]TWB99144.1 polysaccharide export outer membrane protein [Rhizobium sp. ERR 942]GES53694.1 capsular polysaccharide biosynthesis protein [Rhizobium dioscoreae]GLU85156.1 capsular polysaccharide biosynthesis protein [Rhizobium sp. NBRC 114257]